MSCGIHLHSASFRPASIAPGQSSNLSALLDLPADQGGCSLIISYDRPDCLVDPPTVLYIPGNQVTGTVVVQTSDTAKPGTLIHAYVNSGVNTVTAGLMLLIGTGG